MPTYFHFWYDNPNRPNDEVIFNGQLESHRCSFIMRKVGCTDAFCESKTLCKNGKLDDM